MEVVVTGAAGYVGTVLVPRLLAAGHRVVAVDRPNHGSEGLERLVGHEGLEVQVGDIAEPGVLLGLVESADAVIHLAALVGYPACEANPGEAVRCNVTATERVVELAGRDCLVMLASTDSVYGPVPGGRCAETVPCAPTSLYGKTKLQAEELVLGLDNSIVLRFPSSFGVSPCQRWDLLLNDFVRMALRTGRLDLYEPYASRSFVHVVDIARSFEFALENASRMRQAIFNAGDPSLHLTKAALVDRIASALELDVVVTHSAEGRDEERRDFEMPFDRIMELGYSTSIGLQEGIEELASAMGVAG